MKRDILNTLKNLCKIELLLAIFFLLVPFLLPLTSGVLLSSISAYAYATNASLFLTSLIVIGFFIIADGTLNEDRRYNIVLGILLALVVGFPVGEYRIIHDMVAILFFIGNAYVITWHSKIVPKWLKVIAFAVILLVIGAFFFQFISLFIAESLGFLLMSGFMFMRYLKLIKK